MNIPRYWARLRATAKSPDGAAIDLTAWGWSGTSKLEAERKASARLQVLIGKVETGADLGAYGYGTRPLREEIIEEIRTVRGDLAGMITRNGYGTLVLNTTQAMFIDVDVDETDPTFFGRLLGKKIPHAQEAQIARFEEALQSVAGGRFRIYRTAGGYRLLAAHRPYDAREAQTEAIMKSVGADPAFEQLCRHQESFRARLTPKPWRCGHSLPPGQYPREDAKLRERFAVWLSKYDELTRGMSVCRFLKEVGSGAIHPDLAQVIQLHDQRTRASEQAPLA